MYDEKYKGRLIGKGASADVYAIEGGKVIKLFKNGTKKQTVEREFDRSWQLNGMGIPMPNVYELIEYEGRYGIIYEYIDGVTMTEMLTSKPWTVKKAAVRMAELHHSIQKSYDGDLPEVKTNLKRRISNVDLLCEDSKRKLNHYIDQLPDGNTICHGDFHFNNILIRKDQGIVIDWMDAVKGNPLFDVARVWVLTRYADIPQDTNFIIKQIGNRLNKILSEAYLAHYIQLTGYSMSQIEEWKLPAAAARLSEGISMNTKKVILAFVNSKLCELP